MIPDIHNFGVPGLVQLLEHWLWPYVIERLGILPIVVRFIKARSLLFTKKLWA